MAYQKGFAINEEDSHTIQSGLREVQVGGKLCRNDDNHCTVTYKCSQQHAMGPSSSIKPHRVGGWGVLENLLNFLAAKILIRML